MIIKIECENEYWKCSPIILLVMLFFVKWISMAWWTIRRLAVLRFELEIVNFTSSQDAVRQFQNLTSVSVFRHCFTCHGWIHRGFCTGLPQCEFFWIYMVLYTILHCKNNRWPCVQQDLLIIIWELVKGSSIIGPSQLQYFWSSDRCWFLNLRIKHWNTWWVRCMG